MKKVTFTRAIAPSKKREEITRPDYPGYLVTLSNLPGIEIVIARGSRTHVDGSWRFDPDVWMPFERTTGLSVSIKTTRGRTRTECYEKLVAALCAYTPEKFATYMEERAVLRMTTLLKGESP